MQASFWQCIHLANLTAFTQSRRRYFFAQNCGPFQPGDLAYVYGSINECFKELFEDRRYQLALNEEGPFQHKGRYCLVLRQLRGDRYLVCHLTTFGVAKSRQDIGSPAGRYFALCRTLSSAKDTGSTVSSSGMCFGGRWVTITCCSVRGQNHHRHSVAFGEFLPADISFVDEAIGNYGRTPGQRKHPVSTSRQTRTR